MAAQNRPASLVISVDIPQAQEESAIIPELLNLFRRHRVAALWSLEFRRPTPLVDRVHGAWREHEFGVLATSEWAGPSAPRTVFQRELVKRLEGATESSVSVSALAIRDDETHEHYDLMVKHQVALLRTRIDQISNTHDVLQPKVARYGLWESRPTLVVPVASRWSLPWTARRLLQQAESQHNGIHIAVDGLRLEQNRSAGMGSLEYLLKLASARRDAGSLQIMSPGEQLELYSPRRDINASRSVLRAA